MSTTAPPRYVIAVGDDARRVLDECPADLVDQANGVVLIATDATTATRLVGSAGGHVHVFDTETAARNGFAAFIRSPILASLSGRRSLAL